MLSVGLLPFGVSIGWASDCWLCGRWGKVRRSYIFLSGVVQGGCFAVEIGAGRRGWVAYVGVDRLRGSSRNRWAYVLVGAEASAKIQRHGVVSGSVASLGRWLSGEVGSTAVGQKAVGLVGATVPRPERETLSASGV